MHRSITSGTSGSLQNGAKKPHGMNVPFMVVWETIVQLCNNQQLAAIMMANHLIADDNLPQ